MHIWLNLISKEWHEHKWKLLSLTAIVLGATLPFLIKTRDQVLTALLFTLHGYAFFAPIFVAMSICAADQSSRSIEFLRGLPVSLGKVALVRWLAGLCVLIFPLLACAACCQATILLFEQAPHGGFGFPPSWSVTQCLWAIAGAEAGACLNLYVWITAIAVNQRTEFRVGLLGLLITLVLLSLSTWGLNDLSEHNQYISDIALALIGCGPLACYAVLQGDLRQDAALVLPICQIVLTGVLFAIMIQPDVHGVGSV